MPEAKAVEGRALELFDRVSLPAEDAFLDRYPRQLSVGQAQRVLSPWRSCTGRGC